MKPHRVFGLPSRGHPVRNEIFTASRIEAADTVSMAVEASWVYDFAGLRVVLFFDPSEDRRIVIRRARCYANEVKVSRWIFTPGVPSEGA